MKRTSIQYIAPKMINLILILGLASFEIFNAATTNDALGNMVPGALGIILTIAFFATDIAALIRVINPDKSVKSNWIMKDLLYFSWFAVASLNTFFTWYSIQIYFDSTPIKTPEMMADAKNVIPVILTLVVFLIHFTIVYSLGLFLQKNEVSSELRSPVVPNRPVQPGSPSQRPQFGSDKSVPIYHSVAENK